MALGGSNVSYGNGGWSGTVEGNFLEQGLGETGLDTSGFEITDVSYNANEGWTGAFSNEFGTVNQDGQYSATVIPDDGDQSTTWPAVQEAASGVKTTISDIWTSIFGGEKQPEQQQEVVENTGEAAQPGTQPTQPGTQHNKGGMTGNRKQMPPGYGNEDALISESIEAAGKYRGEQFYPLMGVIRRSAGIGTAQADWEKRARKGMRSALKLSKNGWIQVGVEVWDKSEKALEVLAGLEEYRAMLLYGREILRDAVMLREADKVTAAIQTARSKAAELRRLQDNKANDLARAFGPKWKSNPAALSDWDQFMRKARSAETQLTGSLQRNARPGPDLN